MFKKALCALIAVLCFSSCAKADGVTDSTPLVDEQAIADRQEQLNQGSDLLAKYGVDSYFVKSVINDTDVIFYDMINNEGTSSYIGDVYFTVEIIDPTYYGKQRGSVLEQIMNMGNQLNMENQIHNMYSDPTLVGQDMVEHHYSDAVLFYSTEYTNIEGTDWAYLMNNYVADGNYVNSLMCMAEFKDRWLVLNLTSMIAPDSVNLELDKAVYRDFYEVYKLNEYFTFKEFTNLS